MAERWRGAAWAVMRELAATGQGFYSDDLVERVGWPDDGHGPNGANGAIGSLFRQAAALGLIVKTGRVRTSRQPRRKGGMIQEWRGVGGGERDQGQLL